MQVKIIAECSKGSILQYFRPSLSYHLSLRPLPCSAVRNVSGNRCKSDCRSRGHEFDPGRSHTFVEIDHEIIFTVILHPSAESFKKGCCQLQTNVCAQSTGLLLVQACPGKRVVLCYQQMTLVVKETRFLLSFQTKW